MPSTWLFDDTLPQEIIITKNLVYTPADLQCYQPIRAEESADYGAYTFHLNGLSIIFRIAKITPTKAGQFVALWKLIEKGPIQKTNNPS